MHNFRSTGRNGGILFAAGLLAAAGIGCTANASRTQAAGKKGDMAVPVTVAAVAQKDVPLDVQVIGNVEAYSAVVVKAQITGQIQRVHFREGEFVRKGDLLFSIDPSPFEAALS